MLTIDLHTHSVASGHALNTVYELARTARDKGLNVIGVADHGPAMEGAPHEGYFWVSDQVDELFGVSVRLGIEANILSTRGDIDLSEPLLKKQRVVYAGLHARTPYLPRDIESNTVATIHAMRNPYVQVISHPYRPEFPVDIRAVFEEAVRTRTLLELNANAFSLHSSDDVFLAAYRTLATLARQHDVPLIVGSDAHVALRVGDDASVVRAKDLINLSDDLLINNRQDPWSQWTKMWF